MADIWSPQKRSEVMSRIKGRDTKPEITLRSALHRAGYRFRKNDRRLPGAPDIVLPKYRTVVFVHGCFWHGHTGCSDFVWPKSRPGFWKKKILENKKRDQGNAKKLKMAGWLVIEVWECQLADSKSVQRFLRRFKATVTPRHRNVSSPG
jgi:DNA mismatch endonuclease (patch repair protein)